MAGFSTLARIALARTAIGAMARHLPGMERVFNQWALKTRNTGGLFAGVYATRAAALAAIPVNRASGWDNADAAAIFDGMLPNQPSAHAVFFWVSQLLRQGATLVDLGVVIGITYFLYTHRTALPEAARWTVVEVPAVAQRGAEIAAERKADSLSFATNLFSAGPCDILLSAGAIQYMESSIPGLIEHLDYRPSHILLNKVPLTEGRQFWSLQNFGAAVSPYQVWNEAAFLEYFARHGYRLRDRWRVTELCCDIPFHPSHHVSEMAGFCFQDAQ